MSIEVAPNTAQIRRQYRLKLPTTLEFGPLLVEFGQIGPESGHIWGRFRTEVGGCMRSPNLAKWGPSSAGVDSIRPNLNPNHPGLGQISAST